MRQLGSLARAALRHKWLSGNKQRFSDRDAERKLRLLVDVSVIMRHDAATGIQRVVRAVWSELSHYSGQQFDVLPVFATSKHGYCYAPLDFLDRNAKREQIEPVATKAGDKFFGLDFSAHLLPKYRSQLEAWRRSGASIHMVVYDLLPLLRPDWFSNAAAANFRKWFATVVEQADQAICISDQVARDLREQVDRANHGQRLDVARLRLGGDIAASVPTVGMTSATLKLLNGLRFRPTVLMVGTVEPRKGYDVALDALEHLWSTSPTKAPDLVIIGKAGWKTNNLQERLRSHPQSGKKLHWLNQVSDEALCRFYSDSRVLLMASRGEGFGLPLVEAAMHGRPILARDLPVFREQNLPMVRFFEDDRPESLAASLMELLSDAQGPKGTPTLPTWSECVRQLLIEIGFEVEPGKLEPRLNLAL